MARTGQKGEGGRGKRDARGKAKGEVGRGGKSDAGNRTKAASAAPKSKIPATNARNDARWEEQVDGLFQLPLAEFTAARNALAGRLKKGSHVEEAERVKSLPKPGVPAWVVNQIYWAHRDDFDKLMAAGEEFREAQAAQLDGKAGDIRGALDARREVLSTLSRLADTILRRAEHTPTPDTMRRVTTTLEALSTYGEHLEVPRAGRLVDDVEPPGFEALAALVPQVGTSRRGDTEPTRVLAFRQETPRKTKPKAATPEEEQRAQKAAAKAAVTAAERALHDARKAAERAEGALKETAARVKAAEQERVELEQRLQKVAADADAAKQHGRAVAVEAEEAAQAIADAERALQQAKDALKAL
jgi:hypothetical protein